VRPSVPPNLWLEPQADADGRAGAVEVQVVQVEVVVHLLLLRELVAAFGRDREVVAERDADSRGGVAAEGDPVGLEVIRRDVQVVAEEVDEVTELLVLIEDGVGADRGVGFGRVNSL
jgi:hypothetical protein